MWLEEGDVNTRFFHLSTVIHIKQNFIHHIIDFDNTKVTNYDQIDHSFV